MTDNQTARTPAQTARAIRFAVLWPVLLHDAAHGKLSGRVTNISRTGVLLISPKPYEIHDRVDISTNSSDLPLMRFTLEIVRRRTAADGFAYGARIAQLSVAAASELESVLERLERLRAAQNNKVRPRHLSREVSSLLIARPLETILVTEINAYRPADA
ncbi:MAG TPA: PilZ domain-containing protein [Chthonomonadaceae bacterium]|nr:PilZ domain-containing protein [Chthonomonadaceae bacterium]